VFLRTFFLFFYCGLQPVRQNRHFVQIFRERNSIFSTLHGFDKNFSRKLSVLDIYKSLALRYNSRAMWAAPPLSARCIAPLARSVNLMAPTRAVGPYTVRVFLQAGNPPVLPQRPSGAFFYFK
jgi:hypothetical protein